MKLLRYLYSKTIKDEIGAIDANRIPSALTNSVKKGKYVRKNPYPLESIVQDFQGHPFITKNTKTIVMGSCFSQEIYQWMCANGYNCLEHLWGVVYTPQSIAQIIQYSFETEKWDPEEPLWKIGNGYYFPYLKADNHKGPKYLGEDQASARKSLENHYKQSAKLLTEAQFVFWNIGLTELWRNKRDRLSYYAFPYPEVFDKNKHEFYNLTYGDVIESLEYAIVTLKKHNTGVKILFSIEPVPLSISFRPQLGPYVATHYSKSVLMAAAMKLIEEHDDVYYMPAYEIIRNNPETFYLPDGRHINKNGVDAIMKSFEKLYVLK